MLGLVAGDGEAVCGPADRSPAKEPLRNSPAEEAVRLGIEPVVPSGTVDALELAGRIAALPPQAVRETKALLNRSVNGAVEALLTTAIATETASFDEPAFRANLGRMLGRSAEG
jgi:enoyl-CoA hydratase